MTYYESPNDYPQYGCDNPFYWLVSGTTYNSTLDKTFITIDFGYDEEVSTETREVPGDETSNPEAIVMLFAEYLNSSGPIHGGGFPKR